MSEILLGVERVPNPQPHRNEGGDCYACTLIAALVHLFPEQDAPTFEDCDRWFTGRTTSGDATTNNTWRGMDSALWHARADGFDLEVAYDMVVPQFDPRQWGYGWPVVWAGDQYVRRLEAWLAAGWLALTVINLDATGPLTDDLKIWTTDHFLLLDGARQFWQEAEHGASGQSEVHAVDSSTRDITGWHDVRKWERGFGGTPWMLVRPDRRERRAA